jgi:hypothetical protein
MRVYARRNETPTVEYIGSKVIANVAAWMIVLGLFGYAAAMMNIDLHGGDAADQMSIRPDAPGSPTAVLAEHEENCWTNHGPKGPTDAAIVRINPNDPAVYTTDADLLDRALRHAETNRPHGLDRVFAFCTDNPRK